MSLWRRIARLAGRLALTAVCVGVVGIVAVQYEGIVAKNLAMRAEVRASREQIAALIAREAQQRRTIVRLQSPLGALPEIHEKLHLVGANEQIIYVRGTAPDTQAPRTWDESQ